MPRSKKEVQTNLFGGDNVMSLEDFKKAISKSSKKKQHEKKFMEDVRIVTRSQGLPCIHIQYYCGNKFYPVCPSCSTHKKPVQMVCPACRKKGLAHCTNRINKSLSSQPDLIGIAWGIELKHKINKGKQTAKGTSGQGLMQDRYDLQGVPYLICNEGDSPEIIKFLQTTAKKIYGNEPLYKKEKK